MHQVILSRSGLSLILLLSTTLASAQPDTTVRQSDLEPFPILELDHKPEFPGGDVAMYEFIRQKLVYPATLKGSDIRGNVYVQFIVEVDGSLSGVHVAKGLCPEMDAEALRVVSLMPKWNPAEEKGAKISTRLTLPVRFNP